MDISSKRTRRWDDVREEIDDLLQTDPVYQAYFKEIVELLEELKPLDQKLCLNINNVHGSIISRIEEKAYEVGFKDGLQLSNTGSMQEVNG